MSAHPRVALVRPSPLNPKFNEAPTLELSGSSSEAREARPGVHITPRCEWTHQIGADHPQPEIGLGCRTEQHDWPCGVEVLQEGDPVEE